MPSDEGYLRNSIELMYLDLNTDSVWSVLSPVSDGVTSVWVSVFGGRFAIRCLVVFDQVCVELLLGRLVVIRCWVINVLLVRRRVVCGCPVVDRSVLGRRFVSR